MKKRKNLSAETCFFY